MLLEGNFAEHTDTPLTLSDPLTVTQMILKLSEIKAYDKNPRKEKNPLYDEIKASVLSNKRLNNRVAQGLATLCPLRTVLASFPAYGSSPSKARIN